VGKQATLTKLSIAVISHVGGTYKPQANQSQWHCAGLLRRVLARSLRPPTGSVCRLWAQYPSMRTTGLWCLDSASRNLKLHPAAKPLDKKGISVSLPASGLDSARPCSSGHCWCHQSALAAPSCCSVLTSAAGQVMHTAAGNKPTSLACLENDGWAC
jgi:hypothetical protein